MKNKGMWILVAATAVAVSASVFDFQWEKHKEEKKNIESLVVNFKADEISEFSVVFAEPTTLRLNGQGVVTNKASFEKKEGQWRAVAPIDELADQAAITDFLEPLVNEKAQELGGQSDQVDWSQYGLDAPKGALTLKTSSGQSVEIAVSSRKNFQGEAYLRRNQENKVLLGAASWYPRIEKKLVDFRDKRPIRLEAAKISRVTIAKGGAEQVLELKDSQWRNPKREKWKLDQNQIRDMISKLTGKTIVQFVAEGKVEEQDLAPFKSAKSVIRLSAQFGESEKWTARMIETPDKFFLLHVQEPTPALVTLAAVDGVKVADFNIDQLRDKSAPFDFNKTEVQQIELKTAKGSVQIKKKDESWEVVNKSDEKLEVDPKKVVSLIDRLRNLEVSEYLSATNKVADAQKISLLKSDGAAVLHLVFSESQKRKINGVEQSIVLAKSSLADEALAVEASKLVDLGLEDILTVKTEKSEAPAPGANPEVQPDAGEESDKAGKS